MKVNSAEKYMFLLKERVVPKPLIRQTASKFLRLYPSANILVATERDFEKSRKNNCFY